MGSMTVRRQMGQRIQTLPMVSREGVAVDRLVTGLMAEIWIGLSKSLTNVLPVKHVGRKVTRTQSAQKRGSIALLPTLRRSRPLLQEGRLGRTLTTFYLVLGLIYLQSTPKQLNPMSILIRLSLLIQLERLRFICPWQNYGYT